MKFKSFITTATFLIFLNSTGIAQSDDYYLFPVRPGEQNFLAGTMGEMRGTHFHAGIDVKTGGVTGYPIYAAADGYVSRIKITSNGYGNALYIAHPNGQTTLYAHLLSFRKDIAKYTLAEQYNRKSFTVNIFPKSDQFTVKKGEIIAKGGNSGGSTGPHLHFEIRDLNQNVLNPLDFNFEEIKDSIQPVIKKLIVIPLDASARIDGAFQRKEYEVSGSKGKYRLSKTPSLTGRFGFALLAYDKLNGVRNKNGIKYFKLSLDNKPKLIHNISKLSFARMSSIKAYMEYPEKYFSNRKISKLYIDDGNKLKIYDKELGTGVININDEAEHAYSIKAVDSYGNQAKLNFSSSQNSPNTPPDDAPKDVWKVYGNVMKIAKPIESSDSTLELHIKGVTNQLSPSYKSKTHYIYLWNLKKGLPGYIDLCDGSNKNKTHFVSTIIPEIRNIINHNYFRLVAEPKSIFDTLHIQFEYKTNEFEESFEFFQPHFPAKKWLMLSLKTSKTITEKEKHHVYALGSKGQKVFMGGTWSDGNTIKFKTKVLEKFTIAKDKLAPKVVIKKANPEQIKFTMEDDLSGIKSFDATLNGEFLLLEHKHKIGYVRSIRKNKNITLKGELVITVIDNAGNETVIESKI